MKVYLTVPQILGIGVLTFFLDLLTNPCIKRGEHRPVIFPILLGHHLLSASEKFGWLSNSLVFLKGLVFIYIGLLVTWAIYGSCPLTEYTNEMCGPHHKERLRDVFFFLGLKEWKYYTPFHVVYTTTALLITLSKIVKISKSNK